MTQRKSWFRLPTIGPDGKALAEIIAVAAVSGVMAGTIGTDPEYYLALYSALRVTQIQRIWQ
jgi:hypothetical protein